MTKLSRRDLPAYETNPFASELITQVKRKNQSIGFASNAQVVSNDGEPMGDTAVIGIKKTVDSTRFIKMYEGGIKAAFDLKAPALRVFSKLLEAYRIDDRAFGDKIYFNFNIAKKEFEYAYSRQTFAAGITQLISAEFIAEVAHEQGMLWINPAVFFKGDRLRVVNEYVVSRKKDIQKELEDKGQQRLID